MRPFFTKRGANRRALEYTAAIMTDAVRSGRSSSCHYEAVRCGWRWAVEPANHGTVVSIRRQRDQGVYGFSVEDEHGKRIDPRDVKGTL